MKTIPDVDLSLVSTDALVKELALRTDESVVVLFKHGVQIVKDGDGDFCVYANGNSYEHGLKAGVSQSVSLLKGARHHLRRHLNSQ